MQLLVDLAAQFERKVAFVGRGMNENSQTAQRLGYLRIPAGVQTGSRVRVAGHGNAGTHGAPPGDLYFITEVQPHPYFDRRGDDLWWLLVARKPENVKGQGR